LRFRYESGAIEGAIKSSYDGKQVVDDLDNNTAGCREGRDQ